MRLLALAVLASLETLSFAQASPPAVRAELGARLVAGKAKAVTLHDGGAAGTVVVGHDRVVVALAVDDVHEPFRVQVLDGDAAGAAAQIARPNQRHDYPFAVAATATPDGFTV